MNIAHEERTTTSVFIGGSRRIATLPDPVRQRLDNVVAKGLTVLVGDANGADKHVQEYLADKSYRNVIVYCTAGHCRNNIAEWEVRSVSAQSRQKDFSYYTAKDLRMAADASYGFMLWDAKSNGTLNNIINLLLKDKKVLVYFSPEKSFHELHCIDDLSELLSKCDKESLEKFEKKLGLSRVLGPGSSRLTFA